MALNQQNEKFQFRPEWETIGGEIESVGRYSCRVWILLANKNKIRVRVKTRVKARSKAGSGSEAIKKNL